MTIDAGPGRLYVLAADAGHAETVFSHFRKANDKKTLAMVQDGTVAADLSRAWESARRRGEKVFDVSGHTPKEAAEGSEFDGRSSEYQQVITHIRALPDQDLLAAARDEYLNGPEFRSVQTFASSLGNGISNPLAVHRRVAEEARGRGLITHKEFGQRVL